MTTAPAAPTVAVPGKFEISIEASNKLMAVGMILLGLLAIGCGVVALRTK